MRRVDTAKSMVNRNSWLAAGVCATLLTNFWMLPAIGQPAGNIIAPPAAENPRPAWRDSPDWAQNLVIYVVATKAFTSPNGPESGTFESLKAKLPYLQDLGITGIWLSGHSLSDPHHFFNIWTQYACIEPDKIDPSLGTAAQFKDMIDEAHRRGIKVFLDVITHGVMAYSPLVKSHPEWFRGGSWGMIDYDWDGGHPDLDEWWVKIWTEAVSRYGVDGFRLDLGIHLGNQNRADLWAKIRQNSFEAGHPIAIFEEGGAALPGVTDFSQGLNRISNPVKPQDLDPLWVNDVPGVYDRQFGKVGNYEVKIEYQDGSNVEGDTGGAGAFGVHLDGLTVDRASARVGDPVFGVDPMPEGQAAARNVMRADGIPDVRLTLNPVDDKPVQNIIVTSDRWSWEKDGRRRWDLLDTDSPHLATERQGIRLQVYIPTLDRGNTIELSAHDNGWWEGNENPYAAQGSRALFGYSLLLTPRIPLFMAGEEFDATFHALPGLSVDTVAHKNAGSGRILLGSMLDWSELDKPMHRSMLDDVKQMLSLRIREKALLTPTLRGDIEPNLIAVSHTSDIDVPVPYMRWNGGEAIVVLANRNTEADAHLRLKIPLEKLGPIADTEYKVTDLWNGGRQKVYTAKALVDFAYTVKRDKTRRGGLGIIRIERIS